MCFSATADLVGGVILAAIGLDAARHVHQRRDHLALAALPLLLAAHQIDEAFVWWALQGHVPAAVGQVAVWIYLLFAFVVLPTYVPLSVLALEAPGPRRRVILAFVALGAVVSTVFLVAMLDGPVTAELHPHHLAYSVGLPAALVVVAGYLAATCGSLLASGYHRLALYGVVNLIAVALLTRLAIDGFASLWCAWAAVTSAAIALALRRGGSELRVAAVLA